MAEVGFVVADDFEDVELDTPVQILRANGHHVTIIGTRRGQTLRGKHGAVTRVELGASEVDPHDLDALVVPGGHSPDRLRMDVDVVHLVREVHGRGRVVAAICHGPSLLIEAGLVQGRTVTSWPSIRTDLENAGATWTAETVVEDGNLVTARGPAEVEAFSRAVLRKIAPASLLQRRSSTIPSGDD
jgi:protease I